MNGTATSTGSSKYRKIAVASDEAFCFYYPQNISFLEYIGYTPVYFSPIRDKHIPKEAELSRNSSMLESVRSAIASGILSLAECGGFMYLHRTIESKEGKSYEMAGVIDGRCRYAGHLVNFGYTEIVGFIGYDDNSEEKGRVERNIFAAGMRGHEFHYYESTCEGADLLMRKA